MPRRRHGQPGFSLLLVLVLIASASVLGLSYLAGASVRAVCADNLLDVGRAQYLAESGLEHAIYLLETDPDVLADSERTPLGPFSADDTDDTYTLQAVPVADRPGVYTLIGHGTAGGVTRTVSAEVVRTAGDGLGGEGLVNNCVTVGSGGGLTLVPDTVTIDGDVQLNSSMLNLATITGNVTSTGSVLDWFRRIAGDVVEDAEPIEVPHVEASDLASYTEGGGGEAVRRTGVRSFQANDTLAGGGAVTGGNPAGVVILEPDHGGYVRLRQSLDFEGTLVIRGDAVIDGRNIELTAVEGFPALVVEGQLVIRNNATMTVNGLVYTSGRVAPSGNTRSSRTTINGGLVTESDGFSLLLGGRHTVNYDRDRCDLYLFGAGSEGARIKITRYDD